MGKKRIIQQTEEELLKEREKVEAGVRKSVGVGVSGPTVKTQSGRIYVFSSYNNTIITLADYQGNTLSWTSAGSIGFKGTKKATPFAASKVAETVCNAAKKLKIENVDIFVRGIGSGRESAIRSLAGHGLNITSVKDVTPVAHNGCRPPKVRRV